MPRISAFLFTQENHDPCIDCITAQDNSFSSKEREVAAVLAEMSAARQGRNTVSTEDKSVQVICGGFSGKFSSLLTEDNVNTFTGLPSLDVLDALVSCYEEMHKLTNKHQLSAKDRVVMTMMKLKHNVSITFLKNLFDCSLTTATGIIYQTTEILSKALASAVTLPSKEETLRNMPKHFKGFQTVRLVLDCTEMAVAQPKCLKCAPRLYSFYKKGFTCKYMISVTPGGIIAHISKGYGGRASDKAIFEQSGLLDMLEPVTDAVMVDRGFLIDSICEDRLISVIRPPFRKQNQLSKRDALETHRIAAARVHVERAIQRLKIFRILSSRIPCNMLCMMDDVMMIAAGVTNLSAPIFADNKFL
ncbi:unnamed protein product [Ixodes persulcatus]